MADNSSEDYPTIELFMHSLNQEFPVGVDKQELVNRAEFHKKRVGPFHDSNRQGFDVDTNIITSQQHVDLKGSNAELEIQREDTSVPPGWHVEWIRNWHKIIKPKPKPPKKNTRQSVLEMAHEREEDFGGLIFDRDWDRVYKVNHSGRALFNKLTALYDQGELDNFMRSELPEKTRDFLNFLISVELLVDPDAE